MIDDSAWCVENERADTKRDSQTYPARRNSQAQTGTGEKTLFHVQLSTSRIGNLISRLIHTLLKVLIRYPHTGFTIISERLPPLFFSPTFLLLHKRWKSEETRDTDHGRRPSKFWDYHEKFRPGNYESMPMTL